MRLPRLPLTGACLIALACLACAGCATSEPAGPPQVTLSLTAPTSGATVGVRTVFVSGTVSPAHAVVRVAGKRVRVHRGSFRHAIRLDRRTTRIKIVARARGFRTARIQTTVHYSARTARVMLLARRAATSVQSLAPSINPGNTSLGPLLASSAGRAEFMSGCTRETGQDQLCGCFYDHLAQSGAFDSQAEQAVALNQIIQAGTDGNPAELPASVRTAAVACAPLVYNAPGTGAPSG